MVVCPTYYIQCEVDPAVLQVTELLHENCSDTLSEDEHDIASGHSDHWQSSRIRRKYNQQKIATAV